MIKINSILICIFLFACGATPVNPLSEQELSKLDEVKPFDSKVEDLPNDPKVAHPQDLSIKIKCINQSLENESFVRILEDNQKLLIHFAGLYKLLSPQANPNQSDNNVMNMTYRRTQYLIEFNQVLYTQLNKVEQLSKNCDPKVFDFIDYRNKITNSLMMVLDKYK